MDNSNERSKVYYGFTPHIDPNSADHNLFNAPLERATIAMVKIGDEIHYGYTICSSSDNFSRKFGREQAMKRLEEKKQGYNYFHLTPQLVAKFGGNDHELCLFMLNSIVDGIFMRIHKKQRQIGAERKEVERRGIPLLQESSSKDWDKRKDQDRL